MNGNTNEMGKRARELRGALLTLVLGYLYVDYIFWSSEGIAVTVFAIAFCAIAGTYLHLCGHRQTKRTLPWLLAVLGSASAFALTDGAEIKAVNMLFLSFAAIYWVAVTAGQQLSGGISLYSLAEPLKQFVILPFGNFGRLFAGLFGIGFSEPQAGSGSESATGSAAALSADEPIRAADFHDRCCKLNGIKADSGAAKGSEEKGSAAAEAPRLYEPAVWEPKPLSKRTKNVLASLVSLLVLVPVLVSVIDLLAEADPAFAYVVSGFNRISMPDMATVILNCVLALPVACWLFGNFHGNANGRRTELLTAEQMEVALPKLQLLPKVTVYGFLGVLSAIYGLFFLSQLGYFFAAFASKLPETMTYAEYARRGFFELCSVSGINLAVLGGAWLFLDRDKKEAQTGDFKPSKGLTIWTVVLSAFTLLLLVTAFSKMVLYIDSYGLTHKRIYTTCFMAFLFLVFLAIILRRFCKFPAVKLLAAAFICGFLVLNLVNVDGIIAGHNIDRYIEATEEGRPAVLDVESLHYLSDGAVPVIYDRYCKTSDPVLKQQLKKAITGQLDLGHHYNNLEYRNHLESWKDWNLQYQVAKNIREKFF